MDLLLNLATFYWRQEVLFSFVCFFSLEEKCGVLACVIALSISQEVGRRIHLQISLDKFANVTTFYW